jgi:hypothetical protein
LRCEVVWRPLRGAELGTQNSEPGPFTRRRAWEGQKGFLGDQHPLTQEFRALMEELEKK